MNIEELRAIPITDFLARLGHTPTGQRGNEYWYSAPYREERTPSFQVNIRKNVWYDFGIGCGGDIFSLAGELTGSNDFKEWVKFVRGVHGGTLFKSGITVRPKDKTREVHLQEEACFENVQHGPLYHGALLGYLKERGIASDVALPNCEEIRFRLHGKRYFAIGFKNVSGGFELRNRFFKGCIAPKDVSGILNGSDTCNLFEGFMDYLSWMMLGLGYDEDYLVLNSVALLERSFGFLDKYKRINCYLDNDGAGKRTLETLRIRYGEKIHDYSGFYAGYKDLNEFLQKRFPLE